MGSTNIKGGHVDQANEIERKQDIMKKKFGT